MKKVINVVLSLVILVAFTFSISGADVIAYADEYENNEFSVEASGLKRPTMLKKKQGFKIKGVLEANEDISTLWLYVTDLNSFKNEIKYKVNINDDKVNLSKYADKINFSTLSSGEKEFKIVLKDFDNNSVKITREFTVLGVSKEAVHITSKCKITASKGNVKNVTDSSDTTAWSNGKMTVVLPENKTADGIFIKWHKASGNLYTIVSYDKDGNALDEYDNNCFNMLHKYYELDENAKKVVITLKKVKDNNGICALRVYEKDKVGKSVQRWEAPENGSCDLMVISAHRDDELLFFAGTIPYYQSVKDKTVYTVYMSGRDRLRVREALAGQWSMGTKAYPIFMNFPGGYHDGIGGTLKSWGGEQEVLERLVEKIRRYQPEVIVTHDYNGEYGHPTHKTTAYIVEKALRLAADKTKFKTSYKEYGVWQVKKLYVHMYNKNKVVMNWKKRSSSLDGKTPYQAACIAYDKHVSQHGGWSMNSSIVKKYPNNQFGLVYSTVGKDKIKKDFFENIE